MSEWLAQLGETYGYDQCDAALQQFALQGVEKRAIDHGMTRCEALAIYFYTYDFAGSTSAGVFASVNACLRSPSQSKGSEFDRAFAAELNAAMHKAPVHIGLVYRRTDLPVTVRGKLGQMVAFQDEGFMSSSRRPDVFQGRDMLLLSSKTGRSIGMFSAWPSEHEVVFLPRTLFAIDAVDKVGDALLVQMTEQG